MKSTDELKKEHDGITLMLKVINSLSGQLKLGKQIDAEHLDSIIEFLSIFVDTCHHGKEEEFLFPAMEAVGVSREGGPIGVMLSEHEKGRKLVAILKEAAASYKSGSGTAAANIRQIVDEYETLLTQHIAKENTVLFPMADSKLGSDKDAELFEAFEQLERERIGIGKHDEFHALLERLRDAYGV